MKTPSLRKLPILPKDAPVRLRKEIEIGPDLASVVDQTIEALGGHAVFQRQGALVDIVRDAVDA